MEKKRVKFIDFFRGISIILMIIGHDNSNEIIDKLVHAINMPMFFFISGYVFKIDEKFDMRSVFKFIIRANKKIFIPYLFWGIFHIIVWSVINYDELSIEPLKHLFFINNRGLVICGALWFLTCLFFTQLIYWLIKNCIQNEVLIFGSIILLAGVGIGSIYFLKLELPWSFLISLVALPFFYLGNKINKCYQGCNAFKWSYLVIILLMLMSVLSALNNTKVNMRLMEHGNVFLFYMSAFLACFGFLLLSQNVTAVFGDNIVVKYICEIGKYSMTYMCINQLVIMCVRKGWSFLNVQINMNFFTFVISLIIIFIINKVIIRYNFVKWIIGK